MSIESNLELPIIVQLEVGNEIFQGEPKVEVLGTVIEHATEKRVSFETRRHARTS